MDIVGEKLVAARGLLQAEGGALATDAAGLADDCSTLHLPRVPSKFLTLAGVAAAAYAIGCLNAGYYVHRAITGADVRASGSGNAGARNVGRLLGWRAFALVFVLDAGKGAVCAWIALRAGLGVEGAMAATVGATVGHIWPAQLGFRGGRGIATAFGGVVVADAAVAMVALSVAAALLLLTRRAAVSGALAVVFSPAVALLLGRRGEVIFGLAALALVSLVAHRSLWATLLNDRIHPAARS